MAEFKGTDRFRILRRLGSGGMGVVYAVHDAERDEQVALKTLLFADPTAIYRFKNEFRSLAEVAHPNLVSLYELVSDGDQWFYTMELIDGIPFLAHVRPNGLDQVRLREALPQLAHGVIRIHESGKLHRDLKPSNVLVTPTGRVVILDLGISVNLYEPDELQRSVETGILGTVAYMAPEQIDGEASEASDWYAVGGMLYEALAGQLPFSGHPLRVLSQKQATGPPAPDELVPDLPTDLVSLSMRLLATKPAERPTGEDVLQLLGVTGERGLVEPLVAPQVPATILGRERQLAELGAAFAEAEAGSGQAVYVHGLSGAGKSTLVRHFLDSVVRDGEAVVLSGRCYVRESMPYKGLDGVVDSLSRFLRSRPEDELHELVPPNAQAAARLFPVLGRVGAIWESAEPEHEIRDQVELRRRGIQALRELLSRIRDRAPVVLYIDDLQWADVDTIVLLDDLVRAPYSAPVMLILSFRSEEVESVPILGQLLERSAADGHRAIQVEALEEEETRRLAGELLTGVAVDAQVVESIARESAGNPFLLEQLAQHARMTAGLASSRLPNISLRDMLEARIARLPEGARPFLETLAVAAGPLEAVVASDVAGLRRDERPLVARLQSERLVRSSGSAGRLELYHDRIREGIDSGLPPTRVAEIHRGLVRSMEAHGIDDHEALYGHYFEAGQTEKAASAAMRAAEKATASLAFDRAAEFYARALPLLERGTRDWHRSRVELADALANAGRGPEAAEAYLHATEHVPMGEAIELQRKAADQLLRCGHIDAGLKIIDSVLEALGLSLAPTPRRALLRLIIRRALLAIRGLGFRERQEDEIDPRLLERIDTCWTISIGLARMDNIRAADLQALQLQLALKAGEPYRLCRALAEEACFMSTQGEKVRKRSSALVQRTMEMAESLHRHETLGFAYVALGLHHFYLGRFAEALEAEQTAERILRERCTGVFWEIDTAQNFAFASLFYLGELAELSRRVKPRLREARMRGDLIAEAHTAASRTNIVWLAEDDVELARRVVEESRVSWSEGRFLTQHYHQFLAEGQIELYTGDGREAWRKVAGIWSSLSRSLLFRIQLIRVEARFLRARCALAAAADGGADRQQLLAVARDDAAKIAGERMDWSNPMALMIEAAVEATEGGGERAADLASRAVSGFEEAGLGAYAAGARARLGEWLADGEGRQLTAKSHAWMRTQGVVAPRRMTRMLAPQG